MVITRTKLLCQSCGSPEVSIFHEIKDVPAHGALLMPTRQEAQRCPKGDIVLGFCPRCGFIGNVAFDATLLNYSTPYEDSHGFSPTLNAFTQRLASLLVRRYNLYDKSIIEIGCGNGDFLALLCALGDNCGIGFDPAYVAGRANLLPSGNIAFVADFYSEKYASFRADFVCCRMTLQQIEKTEHFLGAIRDALGGRTSAAAFFQVPNVTRALRDLAFWDIGYERYAYFSDGSLTGLLRRCGFDVIDLWQDLDDQDLMVVAVPTRSSNGHSRYVPNFRPRMADDVAYFQRNQQARTAAWRSLVREVSADGQRTVIWGSGTREVSFLSTLGIDDVVQYAVDVNPRRQGAYLPGTGHQTVPPTSLLDLRPDNLIVIDPVYRDEVHQSLDRMALRPRVISVTSPSEIIG